MPSPAPTPSLPPIPTSSAAARDILPGVRMAARAKYGPLRMVVIAPILLVLIQLVGEFLLTWLMDWLKDREAPTASLTLMAMDWEDRAMPEVKTAMARVARGDTRE